MEAPPPILHVSSPNGMRHAAGEYALAAGVRPNGFPAWRRTVPRPPPARSGPCAARTVRALRDFGCAKIGCAAEGCAPNLGEMTSSHAHWGSRNRRYSAEIFRNRPARCALRTVTPDLDCLHISDFTAESGLFSCISAIFDLPFRAVKSVKTLTHAKVDRL